MGFEPMNTGFADQRVSHFATGALILAAVALNPTPYELFHRSYCGCAVVRRYGFTVL
jgi:hypothetical protein